MNIKDLKPAKDFASQFGVKAIIYGPPGSAKTPLVNTCPRPVLLACEPGLLSMRGSNVPTWTAPTKAKIDEFFKWFEYSAEAKQFDTLAIDSTSQMCNIALDESNAKHGLQQYGEMADYVMPYLQRLYYMKEKHMYLIAKEELTSDAKRRPAFPGQQLNGSNGVCHLYDCIIRSAKVNIPNVGETLAFQCDGSYDILARNRTGNLNLYEPPNFAELVKKAMQ
jgi:AAA domain